MSPQQQLTYQLTMDEASLIMQALGEAPYRVSAPLIQKMQMQAHAQLNPPAPAPEVVPEDLPMAEGGE